MKNVYRGLAWALVFEAAVVAVVVWLVVLPRLVFPTW